MTPTDSNGNPDLNLLVQSAGRFGDSPVVWAGSMGEWPLIAQRDRISGAKLLAEAGVKTIVGTGAACPRDALELIENGVKYGASGFMLIPRQSSRTGSKQAQWEHFDQSLSAASGLPCVVYNSPYYGFQMQPDMFLRLRERHSNLVGFKEFGGKDALTRDYKELTRDDPDLTLVVGADPDVVHGYVLCGAKGAITGVGNVVPDAVKTLVSLCEKYTSNPDDTLMNRINSLDRLLMPLAEYDVGPDLALYYKYLMTLTGHEGYSVPLWHSDSLSDQQMADASQKLKTFQAGWEAWQQAA
jgi:4-hydroxy-tetrahydrodipicolinate synthase